VGGETFNLRGLSPREKKGGDSFSIRDRRTQGTNQSKSFPERITVKNVIAFLGEEKDDGQEEDVGRE